MTDVSRETSFAIGDAVRIKLIDGPAMSIASIDGINIGCIWFDAALHKQTAMFDATSLERANAAPEHEPAVKWAGESAIPTTTRAKRKTEVTA